MLRSSRRYLVEMTRSIRATVCMRAVVEHDVRTWLRGWFSLSLATDTSEATGPRLQWQDSFFGGGKKRGAMLGFLLRQQPLSVTLETSVDDEQPTQFGTRRD